MYQQFFYLTAGISLIISTLAMLFLTVLIYRKQFNESRRRTRRRAYVDYSDFDELQFRFEKNLQQQDINILEMKIQIYQTIINALPIEMDRYSDTVSYFKKIIENLQEQLNESRD